MVNLWKSMEIFTLDISSPELLVKNSTCVSLDFYIRVTNPKVTRVKFDEENLLVNVEVDIPQYPESYPYWEVNDNYQLKKSYMWYVGASVDEINQWSEDSVT